MPRAMPPTACRAGVDPSLERRRTIVESTNEASTKPGARTVNLIIEERAVPGRRAPAVTPIAAWVLGVCLAALLAACASGSGPVSSEQVVQQTAEPAAGEDYVIGPGDTLRVFVLRSPELSTEVPVRPDGKITTPLVNDMVSVGKTASQLARDIEVALAEYVRSPTVSVIVSRPAGAFGQVRVVGQAVSPRALPFRSGMTVLDVIIEVGGLSQYAAGNRARVIRKEGNSVRQIRLRLHDLLNEGDVSQNLKMEPGDLLVIPEARF